MGKRLFASQIDREDRATATKKIGWKFHDLQRHQKNRAALPFSPQCVRVKAWLELPGVARNRDQCYRDEVQEMEGSFDDGVIMFHPTPELFHIAVAAFIGGFASRMFNYFMAWRKRRREMD